MKKGKAAACIMAVAVAAVICISIAGCGGWMNPGDYLGGGGVATTIPSEKDSSLAGMASEAAGDIPAASYNDADSVKANASKLTKKTISSSGAYYLDDDSLAGKKISVEADGVTLYLVNASLSNDGKCIESEEYGLTITLIGSSTITNTGDAKNAVDIEQGLVINGPGSVEITSTKNGIKAGSIKIRDASVDITADQDGLHAEIDYDDNTTAPSFSYDEGGFVYIQDAQVSVTSLDDGIQADTFVYIAGDSDIDVTTNGGAPSSLSQITDSSSDKVSGKGIKAGLLDWGPDDSELEVSDDSSGDYLIYITGGDIDINSNDDAVHSNGQIVMTGGALYVATGDDGMHADKMMKISGDDTSIDIVRCYEGIESAKVEISGGDISVTSSDDGINGADGTANRVGVANSNCYIIISGGTTYVDAKGDGVDSNGSMLISGGELYVSGSTSSNDAALDADGSIIVNGGVVCACGALGMVETPASNSEQNVVSYAHSSTISAGTTIYLTDADADIIVSYELPKNCQSVIISTPELKTGSKYYVYGDGTSLCSFTVSSTITSVGSSKTIQGGGQPSGPSQPNKKK